VVAGSAARSGPPGRVSGEELADRLVEVGDAGHRARDEDADRPELERDPNVVPVADARASKDLRRRGYLSYGRDGVPDDLGLGGRHRSVAPDQFGRLDGEVRGMEPRQESGVVDVPSAHDGDEPDRLESRDRPADLLLAERSLGVVEEASRGSGGRHGFRHDRPRPGPGFVRVGMLREDRDGERRGQGAEVGRRRAEDRRDPEMAGLLGQGAPDRGRAGAEAIRVRLEVQDEQRGAERRGVSGRS